MDGYSGGGNRSSTHKSRRGALHGGAGSARNRRATRYSSADMDEIFARF